MISGLPEDENVRTLIEGAFEQWASGTEVALDAIAPGFSGSSLFKADVKQGNGVSLRSGQYILKLSRFSQWQDAKPEFDAHNLAYERDPTFSADHIPMLIKSYAADPDYHAGTGYAMLYEIAGGSLDRYAPTDTRQDGRFQTCAGTILAAILEHWADADVGERRTAAETLADLCGYRLVATEAPELHQFVAERIPTLQYALGDHILINPLKFFDLAKEQNFGQSPILKGLIHGDLHGGNILLNLMRPAERPFYIIDFALASEGTVGYDAAYLELAHALAAVGDQDPVLLISALYAAEEGDDRTPIPGDAHWTRSIIGQLRTALDEWRVRKHPHRMDQIDRQFALCRIAAGINWARKPISESWRWAALCYASWAARQYLRIHEPQIWKSLGVAPAGRRRTPSQDDDQLWSEIWAATFGFDASQAKFILVAEGLKGDLLKGLGQLPWSAVIDLDPKSDESGLHHYASPILGARRGVHNFSSTIPTVDSRRGTGWMMAGGWSAKKEYFPDPYEWGWQRLPIIREFLRRIAEATSPEPLHVIILPGATLDPTTPGARIGSIITALGEATRGRASIHLLGHRTVRETSPRLSTIPLETNEFVRRVAELFGTGLSARRAEVPGPDRKGRVIQLEVLRAMEENLHVLHSSILEDQSESTGKDSDFWRGRSPTWSELHAGLDIEREIHPDLVRTLVEKLEAHRNQTVILEHSPGAGGTTAALRAAWDLRSRYPVAILHKYSAALPDRVRELFQLAEQPILLVAEASDLNESAREELYRYLSRNNCRVVLLYLRRSLAEVSEGEFHVPAPMKQDEAAKFLKEYKDLTVDLERKKQLDQITKRENFEKYRLPFYYGLITFEREFLGIDRFVQSHLSEVGRTVRDLLEHLAIVTVFSNSGLSLSLLKAMMDIDPKSTLALEDVVGTNAARLLVERGSGVRFMHWTIADKVLSHFRGGVDDEWRLDLKAYAIGFIRSSVKAAGSEAMQGIFRQMFIDRVGGPDEDDRENFAPIIESLDAIDITLGHAVLEVLAKECPEESHFWAHLGRHQVYRLRRDYDKAEEYLRRAVDLAPNDPLHHHTFGLVLRSQLRHQLRGLDRGAGVDQVFGQVNPLFEQAANEFARTRILSPDNVYGYITHIQMIVMAAKELKRSAAVESIAGVGQGRPEIDAWLSENLASAEDLLREATHLYATLSRSDEYLTRCEADLDALYGDLDAVVALWEVANASGSGGARRRRALANAYLARRERRWSDLSQPELRRVVELMEQNLREAGRRDDDYELWFNAYMLIPGFDTEEALSQLALWSKKFPSWRAHYYTYVLHFLLWFARRTDDLNAFEAALEECKKRHVGRRVYSPVWYGASTGSSGLVSGSDLGRWKKDLDFFSNAQALRRVNGLIDVIDGPQAGSIKIGGRVKVFFVPGKSFSANRDEDKPVHFFIGFSPSGIRGWSVQPGREGAERPVDGIAPAGSLVVPVLDPPIAPAAKWARITALRKERGQSFVHDMLAAKARVGTTLTVADLELHLDALIGMTGAARELDINVVKLVQAGWAQTKGGGTSRHGSDHHEPTAESRLLGYVKMYNTTKNFGFIRDAEKRDYWFMRQYILPGDRAAFPGQGAVVRFVPSSNEQGGVAQGISVLSSGIFTPGGLIDDAELPAAISQFVLSAIRASPKGIALTQLIRRVEENFCATGGLRSRLGGADVRTFLENVADLDVLRRDGGLIVRTASEVPFGPPSKQPKPQRSKRKAVPSSTEAKSLVQAPKAKRIVNLPADSGSTHLMAALPTRAEIRVVLVEAIHAAQRRNKKLTLAVAGNVLKDRFPSHLKLHKQLGFDFLQDLVVDIGGIEIGPPPNQYLALV